MSLMINTPRRVVECLAGVIMLAALLTSPLGQTQHPEPSGPRWTPVTSDLVTNHGADLGEYDTSCIARVELVDAHEVVTMVACPDGRVAWFD